MFSLVYFDLKIRILLLYLSLIWPPEIMLSIYCKLISVGEFSEVSKYNPQLMGKVQHHVMSSEVTKCQFGISLHWSDTHVGHVCLTVTCCITLENRGNTFRMNLLSGILSMKQRAKWVKYVEFCVWKTGAGIRQSAQLIFNTLRFVLVGAGLSQSPVWSLLTSLRISVLMGY